MGCRKKNVGVEEETALLKFSFSLKEPNFLEQVQLNFFGYNQ